MVLETHINEIVGRHEEQNKLEKQEVTLVSYWFFGSFCKLYNYFAFQQLTLPITPARAVSVVKDLKLTQKLKDLKLREIPYLNSRQHMA